MIKVCSQLMGGGKTSSVISYINAHPEKRFLYITPYLEEAHRINMACPYAHFIEPSRGIKEYGFTKAGHTKSLIQKGRNITSTHQAVLFYTPDMLSLLGKMNYTIIIDEEITVFEKSCDVYDDDLQILIQSGYLRQTDEGYYVKTDKPYESGLFNKLFKVLDYRPLVSIDDSRTKKSLWYWVYPKDFLECVDEVFMLTYLFEGSEMEIFLKMHNIEYEYIGIKRTADGGYEFSEDGEYVPEYAAKIYDKVHILDDDNLNEIGDYESAMSMAWYSKDNDNLDKLRKNIRNFFRDKMNAKSGDIICGTYGDPADKHNRYWNSIKDNGYRQSGLAFNKKATNDYKDKTIVCYPVNIYPNVGIQLYYRQHGYEMSQDRYALSIMVQFLWRSAIRDGKEIWLYIPSKRMRTLLLDWMENLTKGGAAPNETTEVRQVPVLSEAM